MTHRGQNPVNNTTQIWDGSKWDDFPNLSLNDAVVATPGGLWVPTASMQLGYTGNNGLREAFSHTLDDQATGTPFFSETKLIVAVESPTEAPVAYTLPTTVNGVTPVGKSQAKLIAQLMVSATRNDGSDYSVATYTAWWPYIAGAYNLGNGDIVANQITAPDIIVTINVSAGAAVLEFSYALTADQPRYIVDIDLKLVGFL